MPIWCGDKHQTPNNTDKNKLNKIQQNIKIDIKSDILPQKVQNISLIRLKIRFSKHLEYCTIGAGVFRT